MLFIVYILHSTKLDRYYVGYTNDIDRRISEHNRKKGKYTDAGIPSDLVHSEEYATKKNAMDRGKYIKSQKSKEYMKNLINSDPK